ncbi:MAG: LysM peptidoglycan-binding domain-containing protein, partial [Vallitaleaceae bacterium]|nr:LysM peptidoglycan-binding domain-containing protein [Vallitaleaceae bacterium]
IPFEHHIDLKGLNATKMVNVTPNIHYIGCTMIGEKEIELKCTIQINALVFEEGSVDIITGIDEKPVDMKAFQKIPGIIGYVVKDHECLWDIAKKYRTTIKNLKKTNALEDENLLKGDKIIIVKELLF